MIRCVPFLMGLIFLFSTPAQAAKHALLIGIDDYSKSGLTSLSGAVNDVKIVKQTLLERFGFTEQGITTLLNEQATLGGVEQGFKTLLNRINQGDFVYIHYSGHGSFTTDLNGDEASGEDQTWVVYGARHDTQSTAKDNYDLLDDQLGHWLAPIYAKAGQVILVSDSCHSATVSRGVKTVASRAVPLDQRLHPLGRATYNAPDFSKGIQIGSARDSETASEYRNDDGASYGLFTWRWVEAMKQTQPGETWEDLFTRAQAQVKLEGNGDQTPQLTGVGNRQVFGGQFAPKLPRVAISEVYTEGEVLLETGQLSGATEGSVYRLYQPHVKDPQSLTTVVLTEVDTFTSIGKASAPLVVGDMLEEIEHVHAFEPMKLHLSAEFAKDLDASLLQRIQQQLTGLPGFELVSASEQADMLLRVMRLDRRKALTPRAQYDAQGRLSVLPPAYREGEPELWILSPAGKPLFNQLSISMQEPQSGIALLQDNLRKILRLRELKALSSSKPSPLKIKVTHLVPDTRCRKRRSANCVTARPKPGGKKVSYRVGKPQPMHGLAKQTLNYGDVLTFQIDNPTDKDWFVYILNITEEGKVEAISPPRKKMHLTSSAKISAKSTVDLNDAFEVESHGEEILKILVSPSPIRASLLESRGLTGKAVAVATSRGGSNPLEQLFEHTMSNKRGSFSLVPEEWFTDQVSFPVQVNRASKAVRKGKKKAKTRGVIQKEQGGDFVSVKVFYGTNRAEEKPNDRGVKLFGNQRGQLEFGHLWVSIPPNHAPGEMESPDLIRFEFTQDPSKHVVLLKVKSLSKEAFKQSLTKTLDGQKKRDMLVYVHGFNNGFEEAARRTAQITYDLNAEGISLVPVLFTWPSGDSVSPLQYSYAWTNKDWSKGDLAEFLLTIAQREKVDNIYLLAHSMGTNLLGMALEKIEGKLKENTRPLFNEIVLAAPDIDAGTFQKEIAPAMRQLAKRTTVYAASQDMALRVSKEFHGGFHRLGDSSEPIVPVSGIDMVDVSKVNVSDIGHGYYAKIRQLLKDIRGVFLGKSVSERALQPRESVDQQRYWSIPQDHPTIGRAHP
ncbi:alpha/beta hydrolase [Magnetococcus sp. PR-3]|uniref:alpha/beta hydrolase n=1 Tax=Magnetococcus sp. PR-3 TaxID=3120355 RepID=UPI002FCDF681